MELLIPAVGAVIFTWVLLLIVLGGKVEHDHGIRNGDLGRPVA